MLERAHEARAPGAGGPLVAPGLCGFDAMRQLAADDAIDLPILTHPAFLGTVVASEDSGIGASVLFGDIMRLCGADAVIFPHHGARFSFTAEMRRTIAQPAAVPWRALVRPSPCRRVA